MNSARNTRPSFPPRALARRTQLIALGIAALLAVLAFILIPAIVSHFSRPNEAVADNGMTVWEACLTDWARWTDEASVTLRQLRTLLVPAED